jgi:hypothetical protein
MSRRLFHIVLATAAAVLLATSFAACGSDSGASEDELSQARNEGAKEAEQQGKIEDIEKQLRSLKKKTKHGSRSNSAPPSTSPPPSGGTTSCGGSLSVGPSTTCGFAANVEADYYAEIGAGSGSVYSYSPTTSQWYRMYCTAGSPHVCTGGNDASVYFP